MKKKLLFAAMIAVMSVGAVMAQPRAIGGRLGYNFDVVYQHSFGQKNFIELNVGILDWYRGVHVDGIYEWIWLTPDWTPKGEWNWFAGVGANVGWRWDDSHVVVGTYSGSGISLSTSGYYDGHYDSNGNWHNAQAFVVGAIGNIGLEYNFWFPLSLSVDFRPTLGVALGNNAGTHFKSDGTIPGARFYLNGLFDGALSVKYKF